MKHGPRVDPECPVVSTDRDPDSRNAPSALLKSGMVDEAAAVETERVAARWQAGRWSRTERLRFARILFGNALREDGDGDHELEER